MVELAILNVGALCILKKVNSMKEDRWSRGEQKIIGDRKEEN